MYTLCSINTLTLPIYWQQTKNKTTLVSINAYRNWHYHTSNKFKQDFHDLVKNQLINFIDVPKAFTLSYKLFYKNSNCDGSNVIALIEKVLLDALVDNKIISGDSVKTHLGSSWTINGQDKNNPRCEITITNFI